MEVSCSEGEEEPDERHNQEEELIVDREELIVDREDGEAESVDESCVSDREKTSLRRDASLHANQNSENPNPSKELIISSGDPSINISATRRVTVMSEGRHYLHSRVVAEMVKWYLGSGAVAGAGGRIVVEGTNEACPSLPAFSAPSSPLLLLIGAGGMLYMMRRGLQEGEEERREEGEGLWSWMKWFTEKQNTKPALAPPRLAPKDAPLPLPSVPSSEDRSLNSLTCPCSPRKLLTRPLYVANPRARHVLTRTSLPPTRSFKRQGRAERRQGDGMELADRGGNEEKLNRAMEEELMKSAKLRPTSALFMCRGEPDGQDQWSRASSVCRSQASSLGKDMGEVVRQAREVRRLIREASVDSQASDLSLNPASDLCLEYDGPWCSPNLPGSPVEQPVCWESEPEEDSGLRQWEGDCRAAWRLTGPGSFVSEDWASEAGSLDPWEWDEEGWLEDNTGEAEEQVYDSQLLPNLCPELDLESELGWLGNRRSRPNSAASSASDDVTISASPL